MGLGVAMSISTVTKKYQTTVPKDIREASGLGAGATLKWAKSDKGDNIFEITISNFDVTSLKGLVAKPKKAFTIEQMNDAAKEVASDQHKAL
jgi:bifunctional DNA-binding transcriptional regulator/antitoxin component of YhaV-PrlF toxin-antitoxin module